MPSLTPVQEHDRIEVIDILRGFAIFGILLVNMFSFSNTVQVWGQGINAWNSTADEVVVLLVQFLAEAKFYTLFSFLFGWGLALQLQRAQTRGAAFAPIYLRRLIVLLLIGLTHAIFIWNGDILVTYALVGFILFLLRNRSDRTLAIICLISFAFAIFIYTPGPAEVIREAYDNLVEPIRNSGYSHGGDPAQVYKFGSYAEAVVRRWNDNKIGYMGMMYWAPYILSIFILGFLVSRKGVFQNLPDYLPKFRKLVWVALVLGLLFNFTWVYTAANPETVPDEWFRFVRRSIRTLGGFSMCVFYVSAIVLLVQKKRWHDRLAPLAPVGRMALTNYLLQSVIATLFFFGYGLGFYREFGPAFGLAFAILIFLGQIKFSAWWLDHYDYGPMEWFWRTLTYRGLRPATDPTPAAAPERSFSSILRRLANAIPIWLILLLWAGGLIVAYARLSETPLPDVAELVQPQATATPQVAPTPRPTPTPILTPVVEAVVRNPGQAAADGDLWNLALAFDEEMAFAEIETLAGPPYLGRQAGSPEGRAAGAHIAERFAALGLRPAGDDGDFFQSFPLIRSTLSADPTLSVTSPAGDSHDYEFRSDFAPVVRHFTGGGEAEGEVVWVQDCSHDDFDGVDAVDKIVFCRRGSEEEQGRQAVEHGAAGLLLLVDPEERPMDRIGPYRESWLPLTIPALRISPTVAGGLLADSGLTLDDLSIHYESISLATSAGIAIPIAVDEEATGRNVLGVLPGRDPAYAGEIVILGGHYDHMGQDPDGTAWIGANDNASGIATMLEIARIWQEEGYVPRRTVLFAAWDAEEQGLLGSVHYAYNPIYPHENAVAMLQLDMVGAGDETLFVDGPGPVADQIIAVAEKLDIATEQSDGGGSDHAPFRVAGVPASLMIWFGDDAAAVPHYHRPADTPDVIEPDKLAAAGRIAGMTALTFAEGEPAIRDMLQARADALLAGDAAAFLQTATTHTQPGQSHWFDDVETLNLVEVAMSLDDMIMAGDVATTTISTEITYLQDDLLRKTLTIAQDARLRREAGGWRWDGPALVENQTDGGAITVAQPPDIAIDADAVTQALESHYETTASLLGLPTDAQANLLLYPDRTSLQADTAPISAGATAWVGPETIKLVASPTISQTQTFISAATQLVLANAGMEEKDAPWLWRGLPAALDTHDDPLKQADYIPILATALQAEDVLPAQEAADWAKIEYLHRQVGWEGIGQIVQQLGWGRSLDDALNDALGMDANAFEDAWLADWRERIRQTTAALDALLLKRQNAVIAGDEEAFLRTLATSGPKILTDEQAWWRQIQTQGVANFTLGGRPLAYLADGDLLAEIKSSYRFRNGANTTSATFTTLLTPDSNGYHWAGPDQDTLASERVVVHFPPGREAMAGQVMVEVENTLTALGSDLRLVADQPLSIRLHNDDSGLRAWSPVSLPRWMTAWSMPDSSVHWVTPADGDIDTDREALIHAIIRHVLWDAGDCRTPGDAACPHWLYEGLAAYETARLMGTEGRQELAVSLLTLESNISRNRTGPLSEIPAPHTRTEKEARSAIAQAREMARFLVIAAGAEDIQMVLAALAQGSDVDSAFQQVFGTDVSGMETAWGDALIRGYAEDDWLEIANGFDRDAALAHVGELAKPEYGGRQAGSSGGELAMQSIAGRFADLGLVPTGDAGGYLQRFPISYTVFSALPTLDIVNPGRQSLIYREDFVTANRGVLAAGTAEDEVVWVRDDYGDMQVDGKIVLKHFDKAVAVEMEEAIAHGAGGLLLLSERQGRSLLGKHPLPATTTDAPSIPVLELTKVGLEKLIEVSGYRLGEIYGSPPALPLGVRIRMDVPLTPPEDVQTANVLGLLPGSDPDLSDEVIILGAHYDHVGDDPDGLRYSGANDDASGVAVLLEIARLWQEAGYRPARSILFAAWGAQEPGEIGSRFYVDNPAIPLEDTVAMLQMDSVAGGGGFYLEAQGDRRTEATLRFAMDRAAELAESRLALENPGGRSDQTPFREAGIPSLLLIWKGASEDNYPDEFADEIEPYRLDMTGRAVALGVMMLAEGRLP